MSMLFFLSLKIWLWCCVIVNQFLFHQLIQERINLSWSLWYLSFSYMMCWTKAGSWAIDASKNYLSWTDVDKSSRFDLYDIQCSSVLKWINYQKQIYRVHLIFFLISMRVLLQRPLMMMMMLICTSFLFKTWMKFHEYSYIYLKKYTVDIFSNKILMCNIEVKKL
jgi:hypothetical protein